MALLKKVYTGQEILNRIFTGKALRCSSTDTGASSATTGGKLAPVYSEQGILNSVIGVNGAELLADGTMETTGVTAWTVGNSATLSKQNGTRPDGKGNKILRVAYNSVNNPFASQVIQTTGLRYRLRGWVRGDGSAQPLIYDSGATLLFTGSTSTSWQYFDVVYKAAGTTPYFYSIISAAGYTEWDDISVKLVTSAENDNTINLV